MARWDKTDPQGGSHRAKLAANWAAASGTPVAVGLDVNGLVVPGAGNTGIIGVVCLVFGTGALGAPITAYLAGDVIDVMQDAELVDVDDTGFTGRAAGVAVFGIPGTGAITATASGNTRIGHMIEADRMAVHAAR